MVMCEFVEVMLMTQRQTLRVRADHVSFWNYFIDCDQAYQLDGVHWARHDMRILGEELRSPSALTCEDPHMRIRLTSERGDHIVITQFELQALFEIETDGTAVAVLHHRDVVDETLEMPGEPVMAPFADPFAVTTLSRSRSRFAA